MQEEEEGDYLHDNRLLNREVNSYVSNEKLYSDIYIYIYIYICIYVYIYHESSFDKLQQIVDIIYPALFQNTKQITPYCYTISTSLYITH